MTGSTFLDGCRRSRKGVDFSSEQAIAAVRQLLPHKAYCVVEDWTIFRAELSAEELTKVRGAGHLPLFAFAHKVVGDSMGRFQSGDWALSSMCMSDEVNGFFKPKTPFTSSWAYGISRVQASKPPSPFFSEARDVAKGKTETNNV